MKYIFTLALMLFGSFAYAAEEYRGYLVAPGTVGSKDQSFNIDIKFEVYYKYFKYEFTNRPDYFER
jgi:hypothetical protein